MTNSRAKGKRGELEVAHLFQRWFAEARRSANQSAGGSNNADVIGVPFWVEVKRRKAVTIGGWRKAWQQANRDMKLAIERGVLPGYQSPIVLSRSDGDVWFVMCYMETLQEYGYKGKATPVDSGRSWSKDDNVVIVAWCDFAAMLDKHFPVQTDIEEAV